MTRVKIRLPGRFAGLGECPESSQRPKTLYESKTGASDEATTDGKVNHPRPAALKAPRRVTKRLKVSRKPGLV